MDGNNVITILLLLKKKKTHFTWSLGTIVMVHGPITRYYFD
jgi:hypothetical protein